MFRRKKDELEKYASQARRLIIEVACKSRTAHVGSALSCVDILTALYFHVLDINPRAWKKRDILVLSKGHAALALYSILTVKGLMKKDALLGYLQDKGSLPAHLDKVTNKWIEVSCGSLGHGFNMALGLAYGYKLKGIKRRVVAVIGDGETQEGSVWEGALFASHLGIDNFTAVIDYNNLQGYGRPREICHYEPVAGKWRAFGWEVDKVNGHDHYALISALEKKRIQGKPRVIIADTTKGKGVDFMEDQLKWHYFIVTDELKEKAMQQLCAPRGIR